MPPRKRTALRARAANALKSTSRNDSAGLEVSAAASTSASGLRTKKFKREQRHNDFLSRVQSAGVQKTKAKRRRPGKKLKGMETVEGLDGLRDALPELESEEIEDNDEGEWEGIDEDGDVELGSGEGPAKRRVRRRKDDGKIVMRSLKHRPGAMKRKSRMEEQERERFGRNLAQMLGNAAADQRGGEAGERDVGGGAGQSEKWAALRRFIGGTMIKDDAFGGG